MGTKDRVTGMIITQFHYITLRGLPGLFSLLFELTLSMIESVDTHGLLPPVKDPPPQNRDSALQGSNRW